MKNTIKYCGLGAIIVVVSFIMASCKDESPFSNDEAEGLVKLSVSVNSKVTRAADNNTSADLLESCRVYISNEKGVLHKWVGVDNVENVYLRYGSYVAEAFAGDSVPASFDKRYFKGYTPFSVGGDNASTTVSVNCKISNVVVSLEETTIKSEFVRDLSVRFETSKGNLVFNEDHYMHKGYFMMPKDETSLKYTITGSNPQGASFTKQGVIENVKTAHEYRLNFDYKPEETNDGGAFIVVTIDESMLEVTEDVQIYGRPVFAWSGNTPAIDAQIQGKKDQFKDNVLRVGAFGGFTSIKLSSDNPAVIANLHSQTEVDVFKLDETAKAELADLGLTTRVGEKKETDEFDRFFITFSSKWLNSLPESNEEYVIHVVATDKSGKTGEMDIRIANMEEAYKFADPLIIDPEALVKDLTAVKSKSAVIPVSITDNTVENPALQYRKAGENSWQSVAIDISGTRASSTVNVTLSGLAPGSTYEYRVVAGALADGKYEFESAINTFNTGSVFTIPNASMEEWSTYGNNIAFPGTGSERSFWDSGNEGAKKASDVLTTKSTDILNSGSSSARLESKKCAVFGIGKFAAGNLFAGEYKKTDGMDGVLSFGRPYDGSYPSAMTVYANYRPAVVKSGATLDGKISEGDMDKGQIYVALSTEPVEIRTKKSNQKLFNKDDECILAYGTAILDGNYGPNGGMQQLRIALEYNDRAKTNKPTYLIIVCSASIYGDYFAGGEGSLLYVDDFELVYE